jgi:hypothetical protein
MISLKTRLLLLTLLPSLVACDSAQSPAPSAPTPVPTPDSTPAPSTLAVFTEHDTGFTTTDLRDAQDQIVQFSTSGELIWTADGTRLPGYRVSSHVFGSGRRYYFIEGKVCEAGCAFEVRFGTEDGDRRAYLTVDYGHDNPGTRVDVEVLGAELRVTRTNDYPPGTPTLSGIVTGTTVHGPVRLEGVVVARSISTSSRGTLTDRDGFYEIRGLIDGSDPVFVEKDGYGKRTTTVVIAGDTRFDIELAEEPVR